jgi:type I restriction enzyme S subunit
MSAFTESVVEKAALAWMESLGRAAKVESRTLAALRDTLLPKLISGALRVKDAERFSGGIV